MINEFKIKQLGYDFMGFTIDKLSDCTAHHLIIPNRNGGKLVRWNMSILNGTSSHPYLHLIESKDYDIFCAITSEMIDMNVKGYLDVDNLRHIHSLLEQFEREHCSDRNKKGKLLIKEEYTKRKSF